MTCSPKWAAAISIAGLSFLVSACGNSSAGGAVSAADKAYASGVTQHHAQTVQLVNLPSIHTLPTSAWAWTDRVRTEQLSELTMSIRLLRGWHEEIPETGLHHVDEGTQPKFDTFIPGVLRPDQINALTGLQGQHLQRAWLGLLVKHEQGAIRLDQREIDKGQDSAAVASGKQDLPRHRSLLAKLRRMLADLKPLPPR